MEGRDWQQFLGIVGVNSWQIGAVKNVPARAVLVGFTNVTTAEDLAKTMSVWEKADGMIVTDARDIVPGGTQISRRTVDRPTMPHVAGPPCWPFVAASKKMYASCSIVDTVVLHKVNAAPVECLCVVELTIQGTVCGVQKLAVGVIAAGRNSEFDGTISTKIEEKMSIWGVHFLIGRMTPTDVGVIRESNHLNITSRSSRRCCGVSRAASGRRNSSTRAVVTCGPLALKAATSSCTTGSDASLGNLAPPCVSEIATRRGPRKQKRNDSVPSVSG